MIWYAWDIAWDWLSVCFWWVGWEGESLGHYSLWYMKKIQHTISWGVFSFVSDRDLLYKKGQLLKLCRPWLGWLRSYLLSSYIVNYNVQGSLPPTPPTQNTQCLSQVNWDLNYPVVKVSDILCNHLYWSQEGSRFLVIWEFQTTIGLFKPEVLKKNVPFHL